MKSVLIIGIGRFGRHMAMKFLEMGTEVMILDCVEERVTEMLPQITNAEIGDSTNEQVLKSIGIANFDLCVVAIGGNFQASLETTLLLKELGAKYILAKASRDIHAKFLMRSGADEVVYPERQIAEKMAMKYSSNNIFDYIELSSDYLILEVPILKKWIGKTIAEMDVRSKHKINILASKNGNEIMPLTHADHTFVKGEHIIVFGKKLDVLKFSGRA